MQRKHIDKEKGTIIIPNPKRRLTDGEIISWKVFVQRDGDFHLQIWRPTNETRTYELAVTTKFSALENHYPSKKQIDYAWPHVFYVKAGDVIGIYSEGRGNVPYDHAPKGKCKETKNTLIVHDPKPGPIKVGTKLRFRLVNDKRGGATCRRYSVKAVIYVS